LQIILSSYGHHHADSEPGFYDPEQSDGSLLNRHGIGTVRISSLRSG